MTLFAKISPLALAELSIQLTNGNQADLRQVKAYANDPDKQPWDQEVISVTAGYDRIWMATHSMGGRSLVMKENNAAGVLYPYQIREMEAGSQREHGTGIGAMVVDDGDNDGWIGMDPSYVDVARWESATSGAVLEAVKSDGIWYLHYYSGSAPSWYLINFLECIDWESLDCAYPTQIGATLEEVRGLLADRLNYSGNCDGKGRRRHNQTVALVKQLQAWLEDPAPVVK